MRFRRELETRGVSLNTLRAYGGDLEELADLGDGTGPGARRPRLSRPALLRGRALPARAGPLERRPQAHRGSQLPRPSGAHRRGRAERCRAAADAESGVDACPRSSAPTRSPSCSTGSRRRTPLEIRDRAIFELTYSCGLRAEEVDDAGPRQPRLRVRDPARRRKGEQDAASCPIGEPAQRALAPLPGPGPPRARARRRRAGAVRLAAGPAPLHVRRPAPARQVGPRGGHRGPDLASHAPPLLRNPPVGGGRRPPIDPGAARPRERLDHPDLHPGGAGPPAPVSTHEAIRGRELRCLDLAASNVPRPGEELS